MTGLEKIVQQIRDEAQQAANEALDKSRAQALEITNNAGVDAAARREAIKAQSENEVKNLLSAAESAAELAKRRALLSAKQEIISQIIADTQADIFAMSDEDYFALILKMVKKYSLSQKGEIIFSKKDLDRMPSGFADKIAGCANGPLEVSKGTRPIEGGFILLYGGVEENCSIEALFYAAREQLQDKVSGILFS